jgi:hypothetical protein
MAYDADAFVPDGGYASQDPVLSAAFEEAEAYVRKVGGGVDGFLHMGSLDCHDAIGFMERAFGRCGGPGAGIWLPDDVRAMAEDADWPDPQCVPPDVLWAYWSARKFVDVCVEHGLGIWFS